ncbi:MAG TPA: toll/interleukin-1 receptor domain-containing protein [Methylocystis sp.]|nr:toll/interleukin-1 receptor domain-containing protein [Methylocystis sp.]
MKFFMAYSRADRDYAASLVSELERRGVSVYRDEKALEPGVDWDSALREALNESNAAILVLPREGARGANNAIFEAGAAKAMGKKVLVVARGAGDREFPDTIADVAIFNAGQKPLHEIADALVRNAA